MCVFGLFQGQIYTKHVQQLWVKDESMTHLSWGDSPVHPGCSSSARSWTDSGTRADWGAQIHAASPPNRAPCDRAASGAASASSAHTASGEPYLSGLHWRRDPAKTPRAPDLSVWKKKKGETYLKSHDIFCVMAVLWRSWAHERWLQPF